MKENNIDYSKEGVNLNYDSLMFEVTRKCNLNCKHCFRGEAQNITMSNNIIDRALDQIGYCYHFNLTGGEPFLVPDVIKYLVDGIIKRGKRFLSFSVVVNGTILDNKAIESIKAINNIATYYFEKLLPEAYKNQGKEYSFYEDFGKNPEKEKPIAISISVDEFHNNNIDKALTFYKKYANKYVDVKRQDEWTREQEDGSILTMAENHILKSRYGMSWVSKEGMAERNNIGYKENACQHCANICHRIHLEDEVKCQIQICANGNVCLAEGLSYEHIDKYAMGNIIDKPISCMIVDWQWKEPLECKEVYDMLELKSILDYDKFTDDFPNADDNTKKILQFCVDFMCAKRKALKLAHEQFPYLPYDDLVNAVDADFNIHTDGAFAEYMRLYYEKYKEKYPNEWKYSFIKEQAICNKYKRLNRMLAISNGDFSYGLFGGIFDSFCALLNIGER